MKIEDEAYELLYFGIKKDIELMIKLIKLKGGNNNDQIQYK